MPTKESQRAVGCEESGDTGMKDTSEVREALVEMATLLANIAQAKINAISQETQVEQLALVSHSSGLAEAAALLRTVHDALCETNFVPERKITSAKVFVN